MAVEQISTVYKPEFSLGALYQGFNAGNADNASQLANLTKEWELQKSQAEDPYKVMSTMYEGALANAKQQSPDYIPWQLQGQIGQMQTQDAAGRMKQAMYDDELAASQQEQRNKLQSGQTANKFGAYQMGRLDNALGGTNSIGFPMQSQQQDYQSPVNTNYSNEGRGLTPLPILKSESDMKNSMGNDYHSGSKSYDLETMDKEIARTKDPKILAILQEERARIQRELASGSSNPVPNASGPAPVFSNFQQPQQQGKNPWIQGINPADPVMSVMMDTPEFRQKLAQGEQKTDSAEALLDKRLQAMRDLAGLKQKAVAGDKTAEQALVGYLDRQVASGQMSDGERAQHLSEYSNAKFAAKVQPGQQLGPNVAPNVFVPKPEQPQVNIGTNVAANKPTTTYKDGDTRTINGKLLTRKNGVWE